MDRKFVRIAATSAVVLSALALSFPASATSTQVSGNGVRSRCELALGGGPGNANAACLYYDHNASSASGMWAAGGSYRSLGTKDGNNPADETFGVGDGGGQAVWNNATALESEWDADAFVFVNSDYAGNSNWVAEDQGGPLTQGTGGLWNNEASIMRD